MLGVKGEEQKSAETSAPKKESLWDVRQKIMPMSSEVPEDPVGSEGYGKCAVLVKRPVTDITKDCFEIQDRPLPEELKEGTVLLKHLYISMDPTHRIWMSTMS